MAVLVAMAAPQPKSTSVTSSTTAPSATRGEHGAEDREPVAGAEQHLLVVAAPAQPVPHPRGHEHHDRDRVGDEGDVVHGLLTVARGAEKTWVNGTPSRKPNTTVTATRSTRSSWSSSFSSRSSRLRDSSVSG